MPEVNACIKYKSFDMELCDIIIERIRKDGPISFCDFMDMALYYPSKGYYMSAGERVGKSGDYYTSPHVSSLYGRILGKQLEEMWHILNDQPFTIIEYGAGNGQLCYDILNYLKENDSLYQRLKYYIVEKSDAMNLRAQSLVKDKTIWLEDIEQLEPVTGCILSNELIDNFPVHVVVMKDELMEVFVDFKEEFIEVLKPASADIKNYLAAQQIVLPKGYRTEINLKAPGWIQTIADKLKRGFVITIDYGFPSYELYAPQRNSGTLACYYQHTTGTSPYCNVGLQDITAHVNFSALHFWGKQKGLECTGFCNQSYFMRSLGLVNDLREIEKKYSTMEKQILIRLHTLLFEMGQKFKVFIQQKDVATKEIRGMQLAEQFY